MGGIDFGYCGVAFETSRSFTLSNVVPRSVHGTTVRYSIEGDSPNFTYSHSNGVLQAGKKQEIMINFKADEAKVMIALILVKLQDVSNGQELTRSLKVSAIGKYPFITVSTEMLDFDELLIGKTATKEVTVTNSSPVPLSFTIERMNDDGKDNSISLSHDQCNLLPNTSNTVSVTYTPLI